MNPLISVIIPIYNVEKYLDKCVESVVSQTYKNLEVILVDDGSPDNCPAMCDEWAKKDSRIKVLHKQNGGLSSSRNAGLSVATGDYIGFVDSDDYIAQDMYEKLLQLCKGPNVLANSHFARVTEEGSLSLPNTPHKSGGEITAEEYLEELLLHIGDVSVCTKLFHKDIIGSARFDENKLNEDLLFILEIVSKIDKVVFSDKIGYYYLSRRGSTSSGYGKAVEDMAPNSVWAREIVLKNYPSLKPQADRFALFQNMAYLLMVPKTLRRKDNKNYTAAIKYIRGHFFKEGLTNKFLTKKNKIILLLQYISPEISASLFQRKQR